MKSWYKVLIVFLAFLYSCNSTTSESEDKHRSTEKPSVTQISKEDDSRLSGKPGIAPVSKQDDSGKTEKPGKTAVSNQNSNKGLKARQCKALSSSILKDKLPKSMGKYVVESMEQVGECLRITIKHGGETSQANFHLLWNGTVMKSLPPIATLSMEGSIFEDTGTTVVQELDFNLDVLKTFGKRIHIRLKDKDVEQVTFSFE